MTRDVKNIGRFEETLDMSSGEEELFSIYKKDLPLIPEIFDEYIDEKWIIDYRDRG